MAMALHCEAQPHSNRCGRRAQRANGCTANQSSSGSTIILRRCGGLGAGALAGAVILKASPGHEARWARHRRAGQTMPGAGNATQATAQCWLERSAHGCGSGCIGKPAQPTCRGDRSWRAPLTDESDIEPNRLLAGGRGSSVGSATFASRTNELESSPTASKPFVSVTAARHIWRR